MIIGKSDAQKALEYDEKVRKMRSQEGKVKEYYAYLPTKLSNGQWCWLEPYKGTLTFGYKGSLLMGDLYPVLRVIRHK